MHGTRLLLGYAILTFIACSQNEATVIRNDFKKHYDQYEVHGSFALYDPQKEQYILYNQSQFSQAFSPASTFKICNSLIGIETGVIQDENFIITWDSINRQFPGWNSDQDLKSAFKNSTVWYYQELARRVGGKRMKYWLDKSGYGNADTAGGIDQFWLSGGLKITPQQQIDFLKKLHDNKLPFSLRSMDKVKNIMIVKDTADYVLRAKTGWGGHGDEDVGWFVGYVEQKGNVYYFANCVQLESNLLNDANRARKFEVSRKEIVYKILEDLGVKNE